MAEKEKKVYIGGQAVMEGVMMKAPDRMGIAVRRASDGGIETFVKPVEAAAKKHKVLGWPFIRGVVSFIESLTEGMKTITRSAEMIGDESMQEEPTKFEKWLSKVTGKDVTDIVMFVAVVLAVALAIGLFFVLPSLAGSLFNHLLPGKTVLVNLLEGVVRILIFLCYILIISRMKEIKRVFMYHGAEHKTVFCNEAGEELTVENCRKYSRLHPRCGTAFLLIVMVISLVVTSVASVFGLDGNAVTRILVRLALLPVIAGISYEFLRWTGTHNNVITRILRWPGLQMQRLTTIEPTDDMLEVAIVAMQLAKGEYQPPVEEAEMEEEPSDEEEAMG